ncbi:family 78 glycoside hydrolase catalytic domain [Clostridium folliculivorans]|uniref:alpha-L-rhamnosidase n=1 Tax=Clostridium folliculivorans TaxID=2886038 RepID=A0A9W5Y4U3_9CLOT|nr:family 78 glycoside hydrolase catalytic domain [Clostridium folliculivorans]GKU26472.1 alpha-rhamnosidase [Clostridium folliculivorans]GKU29096.1 alpha-rhamnosidase [Clostridium folliculivorans]
MNISNIRINNQDLSIKVDSNSLIISWIADKRQRSYEINIEKEDINICKSKKVNSADNIISLKDLQLEPETEYTVTIRLWGESDNCTGSTKFRTALFGDFIGKWISNGEKLENEIDYYKDNRNCLIRRKFNVSDEIKEAFLYIVGLGYYNVYLNGAKVGESELNTDWTKYSKGIYYDVYEVSKFLNKGDNIISVELGNGWYNPAPLKLFGKYNLRDVLDIGEPKLVADLKINTQADEKINISTDESWEVSKGPYLFNNIYLGERFDARLANETWKGFNSLDVKWENAVLTTSPGGKLMASFIEKSEKAKIVQAKNMSINKNQNVLIDFGETVQGFIDINFIGEAGQEVQLIYGENLNSDGTVNVISTLAGFVGRFFGNFQVPGGPGAPEIADQRDLCILNDGKTHYVNKFTYHSFRYVEVKGISLENITDIKAIYVHTKLEEAGSFKCSNELLNRLYEVARNTKLNNIHSLFEDCARERFGYGGDVVCLSASQMFMFDTENLYEKVIKDFRYDIRENGGVTETAPYMGIKSNGTGDGAGPLGWQLVYSYIIKKMYQYYGNTKIIESEYKYVKNQVDYLISLGLEYLSKCCLGDWGSTDAVEVDNRKVAPAAGFTASCFYYYHIYLLSEFAKIIGNEDDYEEYRTKAEEVKRSIISLYKNEDGTYADKSQTSYAFALYFNLDEEPQKLAEKFADKIKNNNYYITCGIFGMFMTYEVLNKYSYQDVVYKWISKEGENTFYSMIKREQSTLSEYFVYGEPGSDNHAMYSSYIQWFYEGLAGINIAEDSYGANKIFIKPYFEEDIDFVHCKYKSIKGDIVSNWMKDNDEILWHIEIPRNLSSCLLILDKKYKNFVREFEVEKEDENSIYIEISSCNGRVNLRLCNN